MRRGSVLQLVALGVLAGGIAVVIALFIPWLPDSASEEADRIDFVFWFVTGICLFIFSIVAAVIAYSILKFRVRPDDDSDGPPIHGHTGLEIAWTAVPAVLVTAIAIVSAVVLAKNDRIPKAAAKASATSVPSALRVNVKGQQFAWTFEYPQFADKASGTLHLPVGTPVDLAITSADVTHSFWVPEFGQKLDAIPGSVNHLRVTPNRRGTFPVICMELCGLGHAVMRTRAVVQGDRGFLAWVRGGAQAQAGGGQGASLFEAQGCSGCHTLSAAGSSGATGPDLDKLPAEAEKAGKPLEQFIRESIVTPNAYVEPGFQPGVMPQDYGSKLSKAELGALVQFLLTSSKGKS